MPPLTVMDLDLCLVQHLHNSISVFSSQKLKTPLFPHTANDVHVNLCVTSQSFGNDRNIDAFDALTTCQAPGAFAAQIRDPLVGCQKSVGTPSMTLIVAFRSASLTHSYTYVPSASAFANPTPNTRSSSLSLSPETCSPPQSSLSHSLLRHWQTSSYVVSKCNIEWC